MKHLTQISLLIIGCLFLSANTATLAPADKKVALVTFYCDKKIGVESIAATAAVNELTNDPNFNLKPILDKAYAKFVNEFAKDFPFKLLDKKDVTDNVEYKKYESKFMWDTTKTSNKLLGVQYAVEDGFIWAFPCAPCVAKDEKKDECQLMKIFKDKADGVMFVFLDYNIESRLMGVAAGVTANITIAMYDKKCDKVFRIRESGKSKGKVPAVAGVPVMKAEKIQPLCEDATDVLFKDLEGRLGKIVKKSADF